MMNPCWNKLGIALALILGSSTAYGGAGTTDCDVNRSSLAQITWSNGQCFDAAVLKQEELGAQLHTGHQWRTFEASGAMFNCTASATDPACRTSGHFVEGSGITAIMPPQECLENGATVNHFFTGYAVMDLGDMAGMSIEPVFDFGFPVPLPATEPVLLRNNNLIQSQPGILTLMETAGARRACDGQGAMTGAEFSMVAMHQEVQVPAPADPTTLVMMESTLPMNAILASNGPVQAQAWEDPNRLDFSTPVQWSPGVNLAANQQITCNFVHNNSPKSIQLIASWWGGVSQDLPPYNTGVWRFMETPVLIAETIEARRAALTPNKKRHHIASEVIRANDPAQPMNACFYTASGAIVPDILHIFVGSYQDI